MVVTRGQGWEAMTDVVQGTNLQMLVSQSQGSNVQYSECKQCCRIIITLAKRLKEITIM